MNEIMHFTYNPETVGIAEVKTGPNDNAYGVTWAEVVRQYLTEAYSVGNTQAEVEAFGKKYKVLKRNEVTAFYDADGNTLFDVENTRLQKEYEYLTGNNTAEDKPAPAPEETEEAEKTSEEDEDNEVSEVDGDTEEKVEDPETGEAEKQEPEAKMETVYVGIDGAVTKLQEELKKAKVKDFAESVIEYLIERCKESESFAADICQEHKTWEKCYKYIFDKAKKKLNNISGPVRSDTVFEWAEDYFHLDDKAEEEKKAKEEAERKKKQKENAKKAKEAAKEKKNTPAPKQKEEKPKADPKPKEQPKKNSKDMDGQMDMFSLLGM